MRDMRSLCLTCISVRYPFGHPLLPLEVSKSVSTVSERINCSTIKYLLTPYGLLQGQKSRFFVRLSNSNFPLAFIFNFTQT